MHARVTTKEMAGESSTRVDYSEAADAFTVQRRHNFLHHIECNLLPTAICNACNTNFCTNEVSQTR